MRWLWVLAFGLLIVGLLIAPFPGNSQRFMRIVFPVPGIGAQIQERFESRDWPSEAATFGVPLSPQAREHLLSAIEAAEVLVQDSDMTIHLKGPTTSSILLGGTRNEINWATEVINSRLELDALELSYPSLAVTQRRNLLWRLHGSGFDDLERKLITKFMAEEKDPELRAFQQRLLDALPE